MIIRRIFKAFSLSSIHLPITGLQEITTQAKKPTAEHWPANEHCPLDFLFIQTSFPGCGEISVTFNTGTRDLTKKNGKSLAYLKNYSFSKGSYQQTKRNYMIYANSGAALRVKYSQETTYINTTFLSEDFDYMLQLALDNALAIKPLSGQQPDLTEPQQLTKKALFQAFKHQGLGFNQCISQKLTAQQFLAFQRNNLNCANALFTFVNVKDKFQVVEKVLAIIKAKYPQFLSKPLPIKREKSIFSPGIFRIDDQHSQQFQLSISFSTFPWRSQKLHQIYLISQIFGSADSFSSGGPGKGMYSRASQNLLNRVAQVNKVSIANNIFSDNGVLSFLVAGPANHSERLASVLINQINGLTQPIHNEQLQRGKNCLKRTFTENLQQQTNFVEETSIQFFNLGSLKSRDHYSKVDAVTSALLQRTAQSIFSAKPLIGLKGTPSSVERVMKLLKA